MIRFSCRRGVGAGLVLALCALAASCGGAAPAPPEASPAVVFDQLAHTIVASHLRHHPTLATDLGVHTYDEALENYSREALLEEVDTLRAFKSQIEHVDASRLSLDRQLDREQLARAVDGLLLTLDVIKPWAKDPDTYSSGITASAHVLIKRNFAPPEERLKDLVARERLMPAVLAEARKNLDRPPRIYTEIAIEQVDGNRSFFSTDVPAAFAGVTDQTLLAEFKQTNDAVMASLADYKAYLQQSLLPQSSGTFAIGADTYAKKLAADEMIDLPLDRLLAIAEADRQRNEGAFVATAKAADPRRSAADVLAALQKDHPPASKLLATTQETLDSLRQFITDHHLVTIPPSSPAQVRETPPFRRSTTTASMDTPGPFEAAATEAFYFMTLPDPRWAAAKQADYMGQWYYAAVSNVSVHEVYPGHYLQFLYAKQFPSDVRKVFGASTNIEGWAHYAEQLILDEGFHQNDPRYRLAQLQDALLRDVRFIAGIKLHTQDMSVEEAATLFETAGHQPASVALQEAKRGTNDPTYGYYTMGKLMILKLREDAKVKTGAAYSLQAFHDAFVKLGPLPLPLIRRAMLGETGTLF